MTSPDEASSRSGIAYILAATVIAGGLGYVIQALVPAFLPRGEYVSFSVYWSAVYLVVAAIAGIQQEVTRAARPKGEAPAGGRVLVAFGCGAAAISVAVVLASAALWAPSAFGDNALTLLPPLLVAVAAYALVATMSGMFYGARAWRSVAGMTVTDSALRLAAIALALALGGGVIALGWAVALPFAAAVVILWFASGRRAAQQVALDVPLRGLYVHSLSTVGAALATGVMISGLPLLLGTTARGLGETTLAALILVITLTRAPLVIPLLALQSYLVVVFRDDPARTPVRVALLSTLLVGTTAVLAFAGAAVGPWIVEFLYSGKYALPAAVYVGVIASAGLTALLCLTGAAALAAGRHGRYVLGWAVSSIVLVLALWWLPEGILAVVLALALAPVPGVVIHLTAMRPRSAVSP